MRYRKAHHWSAEKNPSWKKKRKNMGEHCQFHISNSEYLIECTPSRILRETVFK